MISFTFTIAAGVKVTGLVEVGAPVTTSALGIVIAVAIVFSVVPWGPSTLKCMPLP